MQFSTSRRAILLFSIFTQLAIPLVSKSETPPSEAEKALFQRVKDEYAKSRAAIQSVEYRFTFTINGLARPSVYAQSREKIYQSGILLPAKGGWGLADEIAWDGVAVTHRVGLNQMRVTKQKNNFQTACPTPAGLLNGSLDPALGFEERADVSYEFIGAQRVKEGDSELVELSFNALFAKAKLKIHHDPSRGYWPIRTEFIHDDGISHEQMKVSKYASVVVDRNKCFYPLVVHTSVRVKPGVGNEIHCAIDEPTLKINQPIADSRFVIQPWPSEVIIEMESRRRTPAVDPNWSPVGKVEFPWDIVAKSVEARKAGENAGVPPATLPTPP